MNPIVIQINAPFQFQCDICHKAIVCGTPATFIRTETSLQAFHQECHTIKRK